MKNVSGGQNVILPNVFGENSLKRATSSSWNDYLQNFNSNNYLCLYSNDFPIPDHIIRIRFKGGNEGENITHQF